jgi:hypothetical protein
MFIVYLFLFKFGAGWTIVKSRYECEKLINSGEFITADIIDGFCEKEYK